MQREDHALAWGRGAPRCCPAWQRSRHHNLHLAVHRDDMRMRWSIRSHATAVAHFVVRHVMVHHHRMMGTHHRVVVVHHFAVAH